MKIIPREEWGAVHEDGYGTSTLPAGEVWLHHSVTVAPDLVAPFDDEHAAMRTLERIGEQRFGRGISYTFAVMPTGRVYEGHSVEREGAHTARRNDLARAIVWVGNYDVTRPTAHQIAATAALLRQGKARGWWRRAALNGGHCDAPGAVTACPGRHGLAAIPHVNKLAAQGGGTTSEEVMGALNLTAQDEAQIAQHGGIVEAIAARTTAWVADGNKRYGLDTLRAHLEALRRTQLTGQGAADLVDEEAIARELAPLVIGQLTNLPAGDLHELAAAVVTESGRRLARADVAPAAAAAVPVQRFAPDLEHVDDNELQEQPPAPQEWETADVAAWRVGLPTP